MLKKYDSYQNSGVEWIGAIPEHWISKKLKYAFDTVIGGAWGDEPMSNENDMVVFRVADFDYSKGVLSIENLTIRNIPENQQSNRTLKYGDIILEKSGGGEKTPVGRAVMYTHEQIQAVCANFCNRLSPKHGYDAAFLNYIFRYLYNKGVNLKYINQTTGIQNLQSEALLNEVVFFPVLEEQQAISIFLDDKTSQIDSLIQKKQQMIAMLEEEKIAVINEAVTKGLNPNAPMMDSGIEWLGDVPSHWQVKKLKYFIKSVCGGGTPSTSIDEYWNGSIPWVSPKDMKVEHINVTEDYVSELAIANSSTSLIPEDRILMVVRSGILKHTLPIAINTVPVTLNQDMKAFEPNDSLTSNYLFWLFKGYSDKILTICSKMGATVDSIEMEYLMNFYVAIPSTEEQSNLIDFIESSTQQANQIISRIKKEVQLMQEYRTALISEAVTGKIDVRDYQPEHLTSPAFA